MKRGAIIVATIFTFFLVLSVSQAVIINEIMPNPYDNCSDCTEWFEIYSPEPLNLTNWTINTGESNKTINATIQDYLVITKNKEAFLSFWNVSPDKVIEIAIGLSNSGDTIQVYNSTKNLIDTFSWTIDIGNKSWSIIENGTFIPCSNLSPSIKNLCSIEQNNGNNDSNQSNETNETYEPLILFNFPQQVYNNKTNFTINLNLINLSYGFYDMKLDIKNNTKYLNRFWTIDSWSDKNAWIDNFTEINDSNFSLILTNIIDIDDFFCRKRFNSDKDKKFNNNFSV
jgi:hypothetical protein